MSTCVYMWSRVRGEKKERDGWGIREEETAGGGKYDSVQCYGASPLTGQSLRLGEILLLTFFLRDRERQWRISVKPAEMGANRRRILCRDREESTYYTQTKDAVLHYNCV